MYKFINPNPNGIFTGDCVPRALSVVLNCSWDDAYIKLMVYGFQEKMMPSTNFIHDKLLRDNGFTRFTSCSGCYTVKSFSNLYKLVDVLKDVTEVEEREMGMNDFSGMNYRNSYGYNGNSYGYSGNNYGGGQGNSFRGYSMNDNKGVVIQHLEQAMQAAQNDHERDAIRELMNKMNNM